MFDKLLILEIKPSPRLALILTASHLLTLWTLWLPLQLPQWLEWSVMQFSGTLLIFMSYYHSMRYHVYLHHHPLQGCVLYGDAVWFADERVATIDSESYQHPLLAVLLARLPSGQIHALVIMSDALDENCFRQLRVRLRHRFQ